MKVVFNSTDVIKRRLNLEEEGKIQKFFTKACQKHMDKYVPYGDGNLRNEIEIGTDYVKYKVPYAHYMYVGKVMGPNIPKIENGVIVGWFSPKDKPKHYTGADITYHTGNTFSRWDKHMMDVEKDILIRETIREIERLAR